MAKTDDLASLRTRIADLESESARCRALLDAVPDLVVRLQSDGTHLDFVPAKGMALAASASDRAGRNVEDVLSPEVADRYVAACAEALRTGAPQTFEYALAIGERTGHYEARVAPSGEGEAILVVRDVTERHLAELALREEKERSEQLLLNVLPRAIADRLEAHPGAIAERYDEATILFADLVGFSELAGQVSPTERVSMLNEVFSAFDHLADAQGLEKIKTIGDCYLAVAGLPSPRADHAQAAVELALAMRDAVAAMHGGKVRLRIGLNSGPVEAGVIGVREFIHDLWGDAVDVASRMESHGVPGTIHLTAETARRLGDRYVFESRGRLAIKGKGEMETFFLTGRRSL
ncbi:MAG TPA: adenylate/guanylate cyclase domain-containing protein [Myxococcales bacterium]|jgi:urea transport system substrate-binding protein